MNWIILTPETKPPYEKRVLVKYKGGGHSVIKLTNDSEYGEVWVDFETYSSFDDIEKFCYIVD